MKEEVNNRAEEVYIRLAQSQDCEDICHIYQYYVLQTAITFEYEPPDKAEIHRRLLQIMTKYPYLVCVENDRIIGYAYANDFRYKAAYQWSPESTIYLARDKTRLGLGAILYTTLINILRLQGYYNLFAGVALPNEASLHLHRHLGFELIGDYKNIGYKLGQWHTTRWVQLILNDHDLNPKTPLAIDSLKNQDDFKEILTVANLQLKNGITKEA